MELVSIIVPVYGIRENYLRQCIESLIGQTYQSLEIILVDDGSPDNSGKICDEYSRLDKRVRVLHQVNQGVSVARNQGVLMSQGSWISFVDADDWIEPDTYEKVVHVAETQKVDMIVWNTFYNYGAKQTVRNNYNKDLVVNDEEMLRKINLNFLRTISLKRDEIRIPTLESPTCHLFKRNIIVDNNISYDKDLKQGEDKIFNYKYHMHIKSFAYINQPLYHYRLHAESTTHTFFEKNVETSTSILKKYYELEPKIRSDEEYRNTFFIRVGVISYFLIGKFFLHPQNNLRGNRIDEFKELMHSEPYNSAIPKINLKEMEFCPNKIKLWLLKKGMYRTIFIYYKITCILNKI